MTSDKLTTRTAEIAAMASDTKLAAAIQNIANKVAKITPESRQEMLDALGKCRDALKRAARRAEPLSGEFEVVEIVQDRGPTIEFQGRMLCSTTFDTRKGERVEMELWQSRGGAIVGMTSSAEKVAAQAFKSGDYADSQALHFAVMAFFAWDQRARSMVVKKLGWSLRQDMD